MKIIIHPDGRIEAEGTPEDLGRFVREREPFRVSPYVPSIPPWVDPFPTPAPLYPPVAPWYTITCSVQP